MQGPEFQDRFMAGRVLARYLSHHAHRPETQVLALPRGGVPVGYEVARALDAPLDVFVVRKLGAPGHEELAMGAIATGGTRVLNPEVLRELRISREQLDAVARREALELTRRESSYRSGRPPLEVQGRDVILVDDGLATGSTMRAAVGALHKQRPAHIIVAVPVAPAETCDEVKALADEVVCARTPEPFYAVGLWYRDFEQTSDAEVQELLERRAQELASPRHLHDASAPLA
ncbi:phosphoribosyltransferase [Myxococcus landrumensis]|uniref:Phosphoribosyltransferase n=1 Tax=Myxococcus landrumensis TaxID=2813577 RepID=A0ABX7NC71_9BACT|nr:phosphoribosyltransferase [Myxococcus landrumus]QSQ15999.1 phosphoribosyltransferase [Myxococcus landrumus]